MKKLTLLIVLAFIIQAFASSQPCLPEGITFTTQAEIDNFQTNYPNCTEIEGDVTIRGNNITNLNGLNVLTAIGGGLWIWANPVLTSLTGLDDVTSIGGNFRISDNYALTSLTGLDNVTSIEGDLIFWWNTVLTSLTGLDNVTSIGGGLWFYNNAALTSLTGLDNVASIGGYLWIENNAALTSLAALDNVTSIGGDLKIYNNYVLTNLTGLENITSIGGNLIIGDYDYGGNPSLTSLTGLDNVTSIGGYVGIEYNNALTSLTGLDNVTSIGEYLCISHNNALTSLTGLDNVTSIGGYLWIIETNALTSLAGLDNLTSIGGNLYIYDNDALTSLTALDNMTSIGGYISINYNDALTSLTGLDNIDAGSISDLKIRNNSSLSTCEVQSVCDYLAAPNGTISIHNNATGCNNPPEVANACGIILPCLPYGNYYFYTQTEIDDFQTNYPNCTELEGEIIIRGSSITNLSGLNVLTAIRGSLLIGSNWNSSSPLLASLTGLDNVISIGGHLNIWHNPALTSLTGLENVTSIGGILVIWGNDTLTSLTGLENVTSIGGSLSINNNDALTSLTDLDNVTSIGGGLSIGYNDTLASLTGLENIDANSISDLFIRENPSLSICEVQSVCDYLASPNGVIDIYDNATGCNSREEVEKACESGWIPNINVESKFSIYPNPARKEIFISVKNGTIIKEVNIYNQIGQKVLHENRITNTIDVSKLRQGMYVIELIANNLRIREKLIIR